MSISDKRLKIEIDNIIKRNLSKGYVPTANEVIGELSSYLSNNNLSIPTYRFSAKAKNFTAAELDNAKQSVLQDLRILYDSLVDLYQLAEEQIERFATEKRKYDYRMSSLESQLTNLVNKYSISGYTIGSRNNFSDMEDLDLTKTTGDIDITHHEATLKRLQDIPYKDFIVKTSAGELIIEQNGDVNQYLESDGVTWQGIIGKNDQSETTLIIDIDTKEINTINKIDVEMPMLKKCSVEIYSSIDGDKWNSEYTGEILNRCTTNFGSPLRYIRFIVKKTEADKFVLGKYLYYFIIDTISLDTVNYSMESEIVSKPIDAGVSINKVSLDVSAIMPPATSADYYVAIEAEDPSWIPISPLTQRNKLNPTIITFNTVETDKHLSVQVPDGISSDAYELKDLSVNGQRLFAIAEIDNVEITNYKLYKGMNAWKVDTVTINVSGPQTQSLFIENARYIVTSYQAMLIDKPGLIMNGASIPASCVKRFSTTIYREAGDTVIKEMIASSHPITVYLNGNVLYKGTPSGGAIITYPFKKGMNLLEVITNVTAPTASLDLNLSIFTLGSMICASKDPMESVSLFNLRYNTNNQYNVYALQKIGDKYMVIVKDPDLTTRYDFVYDYVIQPITKILVKAVLRREHTSINVTPRLLAYEVRFI